MKLLVILLSLTGAAAAVAEPDFGAGSTQWQRLGLMRVRDMTPFGLARLDMLPAHALNSPAGSFTVETNLTYQNTWVRSDNVARYLRQRGNERRSLTTSDVAAIMGLPGDAYLIDGEYGLLDLTLHHRYNDHIGLYATIPYFMFGMAFLDRAIEEFHVQFGFSNAGREHLLRNSWNTLLKLQDTQMVMDRPPENAFGDPVLGVRYSLKDNPDDWNLVIESAIKIPRQNAHTIVSTGSTDYGLQVSYQRFFHRNAMYFTASGVYYAGDPNWARERWIPTVVGGWEGQLTRRLGLVVQLYASRSTVQNTNLAELSANKLQATIGLQWLHRGNVVRAGLTENLRHFNNTPDVGLTLSIGRIFPPSAGTRQTSQ